MGSADAKLECKVIKEISDPTGHVKNAQADKQITATYHMLEDARGNDGLYGAINTGPTRASTPLPLTASSCRSPKDDAGHLRASTL